MAIKEIGKGENIIGRSLKDLSKYGKEGTGYLGKVLMSSGERPVLGSKILVDVARPHLMLICGKRGGGKCLAGDTLITMDDGSLVEIKDLEHDSRGVVSMNENYKIGKTPKQEFFKRPVEKLLEVEFRSGRKIKLTPEHPLLTIEGWKPLEQLSKGSRIATPRKQEVFGNGFLRECEVKLLAYLIAEGHMARRTVWFSNTDKKIVSDFKQAVHEFDENLQVNLSGQYNWRVVNSNPKTKIIKAVRKNGKFAKGTKIAPVNTLRNWLKNIEVYDLLSHEKTIPQKVLQMPKQKLALFLNRLFSCDGSIYSESERYRLSYSSVSERLIRQVQHLLLRFGVLSKIRKKTAVLDGKSFGSFEIVIQGESLETFLKEIGFYGEKEFKQQKALLEVQAIRKNPNLDTIPKEIWKQYRPKNWAEIGRSVGYKIPKSMCESIHYAPSRQKMLQIAKVDDCKIMELLAESDIFWDEIKKITELAGNFEVYDISVPEKHNFVANDIIVHNSYSMAVLLEEMARVSPSVRQRLSVIVIDTVGIFWSLKIPNKENVKGLSDWDLKPAATDVKIMVPKGKLGFYKEKEIPVDGAFTLKASELEAGEWMALFRMKWSEPSAVLLARAVENLKETLGTYYGISDIISMVKKDNESDSNTKQALINRLRAAQAWGLIERQGTKIRDLVKPGKITIIDVSSYRQAIGMEGTKDIIVALLGKKLFEDRMLFRKEEEIKMVKGEKRESSMPIVWMFIDEAHMFMPKDEDNLALKVLLEWVRVGRQPGLSLVLATQRPNKLHPDAISQCDLFISHRMTAKPDIDAVGALRPSYMHQDFDKYFAEMPRSKGFALIIDDNTEKIWMIKVRPRLSWDAGVTASAFLK